MAQADTQRDDYQQDPDWFEAQGGPQAPAPAAQPLPPGTDPGFGGTRYPDIYQPGRVPQYDAEGRLILDSTGRTAGAGPLSDAAQRSSGGYNPGGPTTPIGARTGADPYALIRQTIANLPPTGASLDKVLEVLWANGIHATRATHGTRAHPQPSGDAIVMPDGTYVDLIGSSDSPRAHWASASGPSGQYDPTRSVIGPGGKITSLNDYLSQQGLPGAPAYTSGGGMTPLSGVGGAFGTGVTLPTGTLPTGALTSLAAQALEKSPGFQFRLAEGQKALERSAAARGTLLTGGTLKGITRYAQDFASNEYANQYARLFGEAQERFNQATSITGQGLQAQQQRYGQLYGLTSLGQNAAFQQANLGAGYGQNAANTYSAYSGQSGNLYQNQAGAGSDLITGGANARAAGTVGAANANASSITGITNTLRDSLLLWYMNGQQGPRPSA